MVAPFMAPSSSPLPPDATIDIFLYDPTSIYHPVSCADLDLDAPPTTVA